MPITITREDPGGPDVLPLLMAGEAHSAGLYPAESNHHLPLGSLRAERVVFLVARDEAGRAIGTGALVDNGDWGEIKRMFVAEAGRGRGIGRMLLDRLMEEGRRRGLRALRLETGVLSHEALGLYRRAGFRDSPPFGDYRPDPISVFMDLPLDEPSGST